ncbi:hypothetical protein [Fonticella tunisiensis]|uniref:Lipoprotein n=1 Tax=Fonticella tunisiensis TaxID=1096341 RepID=A0A4R7KTH4_9CLOT|nr:hypothetical protein [Fonticella tunisiensis]TDT62449.1 hypothetical protein EDD71_104181 [Fonticella tunisiensis]
MKRIIMIIIFLLSPLLIIAACSTEKIKKEPEISLKFNVSNLTDIEFQSVGTGQLENASKNDFKNMEFTLDVKHSNKISNRKIIIPDIKKIANSYDRERYWFGQSYSQDNSEEKFAKYSNKFVFYSKGLNEQAIRNIFNTAEVRVSWTTDSGSNEEKIFKLGEVIQFK